MVYHFVHSFARALNFLVLACWYVRIVREAHLQSFKLVSIASAFALPIFYFTFAKDLVTVLIFVQITGDKQGAVFGGLLECPLKPTAKRKYQVS